MTPEEIERERKFATRVLAELSTGYMPNAAAVTRLADAVVKLAAVAGPALRVADTLTHLDRVKRDAAVPGRDHSTTGPLAAIRSGQWQLDRAIRAYESAIRH